MNNILEKIFPEDVASKIYYFSLEHPMANIFKRQRDFKEYSWRLKNGWIDDDYPYSKYYLNCIPSCLSREVRHGNQLIDIIFKKGLKICCLYTYMNNIFNKHMA